MSTHDNDGKNSVIHIWITTIGCPIRKRADLIRKLLQWYDYRVSEKTVNGRLVEITNSWYEGSYERSFTFYRLGRCKEVVRSGKAKKAKEDERPRGYE
jgi:hypothetical protein